MATLAVDSSREYDAWLVDLDGTLYRPKPLKLMMALSLVLFGFRHVKLLRRFRHEHEALREHLTEPVESPFAIQLERTASATKRPVDEVRGIITDWMVARPGRFIRWFRRQSLLDEIQRFHADGGKTALVSDYPAQLKLEALGAVELFDVVIANGEPDGPSRLKPWPDGYLKAAERLGVDAKRCLVIGDRDDADGAAARYAGMGFRLVR
ncbi:MAG: HAD-IA family hydrolase [Polyangiaceae bacterium]|nr:HAD-IA family hydrolase [Polyangiaceae bacterium]